MSAPTVNSENSTTTCRLLQCLLHVFMTTLTWNGGKHVDWFWFWILIWSPPTSEGHICSPACHRLCPSAVWCGAGRAQGVFTAFFPGKSWTLQLETTLMRRVGLNQNNEVVVLKPLKPKQSNLKDTSTLRRADNKQWQRDTSFKSHHCYVCLSSALT